MLGVNHHPNVEESEILLQVTKMHRQSQEVFQEVPQKQTDSAKSVEKDSRKDSLHSIIAQQDKIRTAHIIGRKSDSSLIKSRTARNTEANNSGDDNAALGVVEQGRGRRVGSVIAPHKCGMRAGAGQFVFAGRIRLKRGILKCAARSENWRKVYEAAVREGRQQCTFNL